MPTPQANNLQPMSEADVDGVAALIAQAMDANEGRWAIETFSRHFRLRAAGLNDGRAYFLLKNRAEVQGVVGLHHYEWGPPANVWLGWFAVAPAFQGNGLGSLLIREIQAIARRSGYRQLFIETYSSSTFDRARRFYEAQGFAQAGVIRDYLEPGTDMIVYARRLDGAEHEPPK